MYSRTLSYYDKRRVVVTGLGYLTCLGSGPNSCHLMEEEKKKETK